MKAKKATVKKAVKKPVKKPVTKKAAPKKVTPKKAAKPAPKKPTKTPSQKKAFKRADAKSSKKSGGNKAVIPVKVRKAETLRKKSVDEYKKLNKIQVEWSKKVDLAKNKSERDKIDNHYEQKFVKQWEKDDNAYKAYADYVGKNFTKEQTDKAWKNSKSANRSSVGNFMSKTYTNGLLKAVRDEKKR